MTIRGEFIRTFNLISVISITALAITGYAFAQTSPKGLEVPIEKAATMFVQDIKDGAYKTVDTALANADNVIFGLTLESLD